MSATNNSKKGATPRPTKGDVKNRPSNFVILTLQAVKDGEAKYAASGTPWASVRAFLSQGKDKDTGEYRPSIFFTVKAFGDDGGTTGAVDAIGALSAKDRFTVKGRLGLEQWQNGEGETRESLVIFASEIQPFVFEKGDEELEGEPA